MKAREAVNLIQNLNPDDEVIMLLWTKDTFDYSDDDDMILTDEAWKKVVSEFEEQGGLDSGDQQISEAISDAVSEYAEERIED
jgi:hypothetical protein